MPSRARSAQWTEEALYHVLNRGHDRADLFVDDEDRRAFLGLLARYRARFHLRLHHYCLMTNHFHLLVQIPDPRQLSALGAGLQRAYVHHLSRRHGFVGHLFQGRFKSVAVQREAYGLSCGRYIERNPLEAGMVAEPWEYPWSSAGYYALGKADALVDEATLYTELSPRPQRRHQLWREFLLGEDAKEEALRRAEWVVGDTAFSARLRQVQGRPVARRRGRRPNPVTCKIPIQDNVK